MKFEIGGAALKSAVPGSCDDAEPAVAACSVYKYISTLLNWRLGKRRNSV